MVKNVSSDDDDGFDDCGSGYVSWGEYPMNFAAVLNQEEIYRLILAKGGNFDLQVPANTIRLILNLTRTDLL